MNHYATKFHIPTHPQAVQAIWLARRLQGAPAHIITGLLNSTGCPRRLFALASHLQNYQPGKIINISA